LEFQEDHKQISIGDNGFKYEFGFSGTSKDKQVHFDSLMEIGLNQTLNFYHQNAVSIQKFECKGD
jgi:hypothetical protein